MCAELGVPLASEKVEGPASSLVFLGIEIDSNAMQIRLPDRKLVKVKLLVNQWLERRKACRKRELQSLVGVLQHASKVVRPGRTFLRRLIETMETAKHSDHWVRLNSTFHSDLIWWHTYLTDWNGVGCQCCGQEHARSPPIL